MFYFSKTEEYGAFLKTLTCPRLPRHAVGLGLVISLLILVTDQVRVGLRAESCSNADDMFIGCIYHLLHLKNTEKYTFLYNTAVCQLLLYLLIIFTYIHCLILACCKENFKTTRESFSGCSFKTDLTTHSLIDNLSRVY